MESFLHKKSMIDSFFSYLIEEDKYFEKFWDNQEESEKIKIKEHLVKIHSKYDLDSTIGEINVSNNKIIKKKFFQIPDMEFDYKFFPKDADKFLFDKKLHRELFYKGAKIIESFLQKNNFTNIKYYGSIKERELISKKLGNNEIYKKYYVNDPLLICWDIVRFRVICTNLDILLKLTINFIEDNIEIITRCRNYLMYPKYYDDQSSYWAIHIILTISDYIIEIQFMTEIRAILSHLDHIILYKKQSKKQNQKYELWLNQLITRSNLYDLENFYNEKTFANILYK